MPLVCSVSGLRFTLEDFSPTLLESLLRAFVQRLPDGAVAVGWDGRLGGELIEELVLDTLRREGCRIHRLGVVPTPTVQYWIAHRRLPGGVAVTPSHNSAEWHGIKLFGAEGITLDVRPFYREALSGGFPPPNGHRESRPLSRWMQPQAVEAHLQSLRRPAWLRSLWEAIAQARLHVVVDAVNASASYILPLLLQRLGCRVTTLFADGSGQFLRVPEPLPEHLGELSEWVRRCRADVGIAVDPDADRLVLVDERGECVWEEYTIALAAWSVLEHLSAACGRLYEPVVVVNYSTSSAVESVVQAAGAHLVRAPVGELNVVQALKQWRGVLGGEGSGGVIVPHCHYGRDSLAGTVLILGLLARQGKPLSEVVAQLPRPAMRKHKLPRPAELDSVLRRLEGHLRKAARELRRDDGLYVRFDTGWVHIRASNTEPVLRFIAEAATVQQVEQLERLVLPLLQ
jgi:phosphomannomutase